MWNWIPLYAACLFGLIAGWKLRELFIPPVEPPPSTFAKPDPAATVLQPGYGLAQAGTETRVSGQSEAWIDKLEQEINGR